MKAINSSVKIIDLYIRQREVMDKLNADIQAYKAKFNLDDRFYNEDYRNESVLLESYLSDIEKRDISRLGVRAMNLEIISDTWAYCRDSNKIIKRGV